MNGPGSSRPCRVVNLLVLRLVGAKLCDPSQVGRAEAAVRAEQQEAERRWHKDLPGVLEVGAQIRRRHRL